MKEMKEFIEEIPRTIVIGKIDEYKILIAEVHRQQPTARKIVNIHTFGILSKVNWSNP